MHINALLQMVEPETMARIAADIFANENEAANRAEYWIAFRDIMFTSWDSSDRWAFYKTCAEIRIRGHQLREMGLVQMKPGKG